MRVTKTIKEYIEKSVREKVFKKYEAEKAEAERQVEILFNFKKEVEVLVRKVAKEKIDAFIEKNDFIEIFDDYNSIRYGYIIQTAEPLDINSVCYWRVRAEKEVKEKVDNIIITLELGGTKADLDKMLNEI